MHSKLVQELVLEFVNDLQDLFLADLIKAVSETKLAKSSFRTPHAKEATRKKGGGGKRSPQELAELTRSLHAHVVKNPGQRIEQIATQLGVSTRELSLPVKKLIADKRLTTKGQKRATSYTAR